MGSSFLISCASPGPGWWSWTSRLFATSAQCLRRISALSDWSGCSFRESWRARSVLQLPKKKHHSWVVHIWTRMHVSRKPSQRSLLEFNSIDVNKNERTVLLSKYQWFTALSPQICEAEQMHHSCADRERRLQHLHGWTEQQKKQMNQRKQPTGQTLARKALLELEVQ